MNLKWGCSILSRRAGREEIIVKKPRRIYPRLREVPMPHTYDILWVTAEGPKWIETAPDLETAKAKVQQHLKVNPGRYLIFNWMTQERIAIEPQSR